MSPVLWILMVYALTSNAASSAKTKPRSFSSKSEMEALVETEKKLYRMLTQYMEHMEERMARLKMYHEEFDKAFTESSNGVEEYLDNPVNAFLFTRRLLVTSKEVEKAMSGDVGKEWARDLQLQRLMRGVKLPSKTDMTYAAEQVRVMQDTYQLNATEMALGGPYGIPLNSGDCFELGREAYQTEDFEHAYDWLQEAWKRRDDGRSQEIDTLEYLAAVAFYNGRVRRALEYTQRLSELSPDHNNAKNNIQYYEAVLKKISEEKITWLKEDIIPGVIDWQEEDLVDLSNQICNDTITVSAKISSKLRCQYRTKGNPLLKVSPLQEEIAYLDPRIVIYHNLLTADEVEELKAIAGARLYPHEKDGMVGASQGVLPGVGGVTAKVNTRTAEITGLDLSYSDLLVVNKYSEGGLDRWHLDHQEVGLPIVRKAGNKIATVKYFLDDSEGGGTVFPALKLSVQPEKGSALFWFNAKTNGLVDDRSLHGTCSVKSSEHWEAIKWVRSFGNELKRPCESNFE